MTRGQVPGYKFNGKFYPLIMGGSGDQAPPAGQGTQTAEPPAGGQQQTPPDPASNGGPLSNLESVQLTQEQLDELPEWARDSLTKANKEAGGYRTKLRETETLVTEAGGADRIKDLQWRTTTTEGIKSLFQEMTELENIEEILGVPADRLKGVLGKAEDTVAAAAAKQEAETGVTMKPEEVSALVTQEVQKAVAQVENKTSQTQLRNTVTQHLKGQGYTDDWSFGVITQMAAKHQADPDIEMNTADPMAPYIQALDKGIADFEEWKKTELSKTREEYLQGKAADAGGAPRPTSSSDTATGEKWDPASLSWDELTQEAKKRGYYD